MAFFGWSAADASELPKLAIGLFGHLHSGKTTLLAALTHSLAARGWARPLTPAQLDDTRNERALGRGAEVTHVCTRSARRRYVWVDIPGHARAVPLALRYAAQVDAGVLVVGCDDGPKGQTAEHVIAARQLGVREWVVFLSRVDACGGDEELIDLAESETRELLTRCGLDGDAITVIRGSPRHALDPDASLGARAQADRALRELLVACDELEHVHPEVDGPLSMPVSRTFVIGRRASLVVAGRIARGAVARGDEVELVGLHHRWRQPVASLYADGVRVERATAGMFVGALMPGIRRGDVHTGFLLSAPDTTQVTRAVRARARVVESAVFGRRHPIFRGYSPALYAHTARARCFLEPDEEMVMPGEGCEFTVYLSRAIALSPGQRFVLRDNNTIMALGEVLADPLPPRRYRVVWERGKQHRWDFRRHFR